MEDLGSLADRLGVGPEALRRLGAFRSDRWPRTWGFPMRATPGGPVVGIRFRSDSGAKWSHKGGREGLFLPERLDCRQEVYLPEGPTDTAAALTLGLEGLGRPSCSGGVPLIQTMVRRFQPAAAVVVADADEPGRRGAEVLLRALALLVARVGLLEPTEGFKDFRAWTNAGATRKDVEARIRWRRLLLVRH